MANSEQLDLFTPTATLIARGFEALEKLDFAKAHFLFQVVLQQCDSYQDAQYGLVLCSDWVSIFRKKRRLDCVRAYELLWQTICEYEFGTASYALALKKALLRKLARDLERFDNYLFSDSGLCLGQIFNQLEEYSRAVQAFEPLLETYPYEPHLIVHFANTLWQAQQKRRAKLSYIKAWMIAPSLLISLPVKDDEFQQLIVTEGPYMAPIFEWIRQGMPSLDCPRIQGENLEHVAALKIYDAINSIHHMKANGQYDEIRMVEQHLKSEVPDIYQAYKEQGYLDFVADQKHDSAN